MLYCIEQRFWGCHHKLEGRVRSSYEHFLWYGSMSLKGPLLIKADSYTISSSIILCFFFEAVVLCLIRQFGRQTITELNCIELLYQAGCAP